MQNPVAEAKTFWNELDKTRSTFEEDLAFHLVHGLVYRWGKDILFARPVKKDEEQYWETYRVYPIEECDAWYVWLAVGSAETMTSLFSGFVPKLKYIIRKKDDRFRVLETDRLLTRQHKQI